MALRRALTCGIHHRLPARRRPLRFRQGQDGSGQEVDLFRKVNPDLIVSSDETEREVVVLVVSRVVVPVRTPHVAGVAVPAATADDARPVVRSTPATPWSPCGGPASSGPRHASSQAGGGGDSSSCRRRVRPVSGPLDESLSSPAARRPLIRPSGALYLSKGVQDSLPPGGEGSVASRFVGRGREAAPLRTGPSCGPGS